MASWLFTSIKSISSKVLEAIRGTAPSQQGASSPVADPNETVVADLQKLSRMLARIMAVQQDAEEREIHDRSVRLWLEELRGVAYQAEDVLDEYHYEVLRSIVESGDAAIEMYHQEDRGIKRKFADMYTSSSLSYSSCSITNILIPDGMAENIKTITARFEEISNDRRDLHLREDDGTHLAIDPQIRPPTSFHVNERALFGRKEEKEMIISLLTASSCPKFMVLPIVGMGGLGKTMLGKLVYNDSRIRKFFDKRSWVSVSEDFDLVRLTKVIIESMSDSPCGFSELSKLQDILKVMISGTSLFLVLDDVWNEKRSLWECFQGGLISAKTIRILITTRNSTVAEVMQTTSPFQLGFLPEEHCWSLFKHFAFGNREAREDANLLKIGRGIVEKCKGLPLAIKALGGILRYEMDEEKWREVLESNISELDETGEIMPVLWLSYQKLRLPLRPCFLYLSMIPKGIPFKKDTVVRLWMAQGYINGNTRNLKALEEIGSEYFDELQGRSLIDQENWWSHEYFMLHDLIHDLASSIFQGKYPVLENYQQWNSSCQMQHLYITKYHKLSNFIAQWNYRAIRTYIISNTRSHLFEDDILSKISCMRAFHSQSFVSLNTLGTLSMLKHLRYIYVTNDEILRLPESLCLLYNLQTLRLSCYNLQGLPKNMKNLVNLRYLELKSSEMNKLPESIFGLRKLHTLLLRYCEKLKELPRGIEQLTRLHILDLPPLVNLPYGIGKLTTLKPLSGHFNVMDHDMIGGLGELKDMNKLKGVLCISGLKNVVDVDCCRKANLASKPNLNTLVLNFDDGYNYGENSYAQLHLSFVSCNAAKSGDIEKKQEDVLESLRPSDTIKELKILHYSGKRFPSWLINSLLPKLIVVTIDCFSEPNFLPPFGELAYLRFLKIYGGTGVKNVGAERNTYALVANASSKHPTEVSFPSLIALTLTNMLYLEWQTHAGDFPCLKDLNIENCPKLWKVATIPPQVRELVIRDCGCHELQFSSESKIQSVLISKCEELVSVHSIDGDLSILKKIDVRDCPKLCKFSGILEKVEMLTISNCGFRELMLPSRSERLIIVNCFELTSVHWRDWHLNFIDEATFIHCPKLAVLSLQAQIKKLIIKGCGIHELMLSSRFTNLTILNCRELMSINWNDGGLNSTAQVTFGYCPKLKLLNIPSGIKKLRIHECGFREITVPSISEKLTISNCLELISVNWRDAHLNSIDEVIFVLCPKLVFLTIQTQLKKLTIHSCGIRELMLPSRSMNITIWNCKELICINWNDGGLDSTAQVTFGYCPKLKLLNIPSGIKKLQIHECGFREITFPSISEKLTISNCLGLISVNWMDVHLNSIGEVILVSCPKLVFLTIQTQIKKLTMHGCGIHELMLPSRSTNITIWNCRELICINWYDGGLDSTAQVTFGYCPKLKFLTIPSGIKKLEIHECGFREITFPSISKKLTISNCLHLMSVAWVNEHLNSVDEINFESCPKLVFPTIPTRINKLKISKCGIQEIIFPFQSRIQTVDVSFCPTLTLICWTKRDTPFHTDILLNDCPELKEGVDKLQISHCDILRFPVQCLLHNVTKRAVIYDCPRMDVGKKYVYQRDAGVRELNVLGNEEIHLPQASANFVIPLLEDSFTLLFTKGESLEVESLTCLPLSDLSCQCIMLNLSSLVTLKIFSCSKVTLVTGLNNLAKLIFLSIVDCPELCNWKDKRLPIALKFLELECCDKLQSLPLLSNEDQSNPLETLIIINCHMLSVLEGFYGLMNLRNVLLRCCRNISIPPATASLNFRPHIIIYECPLLRDWCHRNSITYYELEENR
ncbi:NBS-LRR disease resistance protein NBS48 [Rhynchospora pubera]|uniref:NBS-LRR disease resistance protein NBS48 n=1 Tax=Rhynchospora pubera TaxID=906938 RepID=A0AAV8GIE4_9POAL|nr:NBS-LRR disease resistance protein NBS48 [Rhynchospora pubera]